MSEPTATMGKDGLPLVSFSDTIWVCAGNIERFGRYLCHTSPGEHRLE